MNSHLLDAVRGLRPLRVATLSLISIALALSACSRQEPEAAVLRAVRTVKLDAHGHGQTLEFAGEVRARVESRLSFRVPGKVSRRLVELGQPVRAGQVLAQLDANDLKLQQDAARAALAAAQANYDQTATDIKRFRELRQQGFISPAEFERRETGLKAALATLNQARAQSSSSANQTGYALLSADAAGVITSVDVEPGQVAAAGQPVFALAHDGPRDVVFSVPEDRQAWVRGLLGRAGAVKVRRWGAAAAVAATVREVSAAVDPVTRTYTVRATLPGAELGLGQTVTVLADAAAGQQPASAAGGPAALRVPLTALLQKGGQTQVWVLDPQTMKVALQPVGVLSVGADSVLISTGLRPGQEVVTAGVHVLVPGQQVKRYVDPDQPGASPASASPAAARAGSGT